MKKSLLSQSQVDDYIIQQLNDDSLPFNSIRIINKEISWGTNSELEAVYHVEIDSCYHEVLLGTIGMFEDGEMYLITE